MDIVCLQKCINNIFQHSPLIRKDVYPIIERFFINRRNCFLTLFYNFDGSKMEKQVALDGILRELAKKYLQVLFRRFLNGEKLTKTLKMSVQQSYNNKEENINAQAIDT